MASIDVRTLGEYIREQREAAEVSLRQLAKNAGVSNPYLSQVERGLKKPSAEILGQIASALRISAETLYVRAGLLEPRAGNAAVTEAIAADESLTERHRQEGRDVDHRRCEEDRHEDHRDREEDHRDREEDGEHDLRQGQGRDDQGHDVGAL